ncbi:MAG: ADP-ribosylglycohydrolase family protein [Armatimonadota bacterium]
MTPIQISESVYRDKVYACWLGKNIGGTLGAPWEGKKDVNNLTFYDPVPTESAANDDLDLQLVWLKMLQERGVHPSVSDFADYWIKHLGPYPWNEYGFCRRNLDRGLRPPISGCFENYYIDEMGSPIRSEIWACVAPGDPQLAASLAWKDAVLDHAGGEGVHGEMFWAALESAAFVESDPLTLINIGLSMIPIWSRISRAVREAVYSHQNGVEWLEARERIVRSFGHWQPCHAPQNHAFTILGWLYGRDYGDCLCKAVNCGYDTDCTGATLGSVLGLVGGTACIPDEWRDPIGEDIVLHRFTQDLDAPKTVADLTDQTVEVAKRLLPARSKVSSLAEETRLPENLASLLHANERALAALRQDPQSVIMTVEGFDIALHYGGEPVLRPGIAKTVGVSVIRDDESVEASVRLEGPADWQIEPAPEAFGQKRFTILADSVPDVSQLRVKATLPIGERVVECAILGPAEAQGYPTSTNVPTCPNCRARKEACLCEAA